MIKQNGIWTLDGCVGSSLLDEISHFDLSTMTKKQIIKKIFQNIDKSYIFIGYDKLSNKIDRIMQSVRNTNSGNKVTVEKQNAIIRKRLNNVFENSMIVIDEVHNVRTSGSSESKKVANSLYKLVQNVQKMKLIFLSGTPMYNDPKEIVFLLNLLNMNDLKKPVYTKAIFTKEGDINYERKGDIKLIEKANGYISYVRGDNPYEFPYKVYPAQYQDNHSLQSFYNASYPERQFNGRLITNGIEHLDVFINQMDNDQEEGYHYMLKKIQRQIEKEIMDKRGVNNMKDLKNMKVDDFFEDIENFDTIYYRNPSMH